MMDQDEKRRKEKEEHKKKLLEESKMPSRMEVDEKNRPLKKKELEEKKAKMEAKLYTFKPQIKKEVPNFQALHSELEQELEKKKQVVPITQPAEFSFLKKQADSQKTAAEDDGLTEKEREEQAAQALKALEEEKKKKAESINTFLNRNFLPTTEKQLEAQKSILARNEKKIEELQKQTENLGAAKSDLIREVITPKAIEGILKGVTGMESLFKNTLLPVNEDPAENGDLEFDGLFAGLSPDEEMVGDQSLPPGRQGGLFSVEAVQEGDQSMPGAPRRPAANVQKPKKPPQKPEPPKLFNPKKPKVEVKRIDSTTVKTKAQLEAERLKEEKAKELNKQRELEKKKEEEARLKKKKATERVQMKIEQVVGTQGAPGEKGSTIGEQFRAVTQAFEEQKNQMLQKVDKKACLVEESRFR